MTNLDLAVVVARTETRRTWRRLRDDPRKLIAIGIGLLCTFPVALALPAVGFFGGQAVQDGSISLQSLREGAAAAWAAITIYGLFFVYANVIDGDRSDGLLTAAPHRTVIWGQLLSTATFVFVFVGPGTLLVAIPFAIAAGEVLAAPLLVVAVWLLVGSAIAVSFALALGVRYAVRRSALLAKLRLVVWLGVAVGYVFLVVRAGFDRIFGPVTTVLGPSPVGWLGEFGVLSVHPAASTGTAAVGLAGMVGVGVGAVWFCGHLAGWLWFTEGHDRDDTHSVEQTGGSVSILDHFLPTHLVAIVRTDYRRARRAPQSLSVLLYPAIGLVYPILDLVETGTIGAEVPPLFVVTIAWMTGAAFTLNVLGHERAVLPGSLLAPAPGRTLVLGHVLSGLLVGVPVVLVRTLAIGNLAPSTVSSVPALLLLGLVVTASAGPIATGIGTVFPRFETTDVTPNARAVVPSMLAVLCYSLVLLVVAAPGVLATSPIGMLFEDAVGLPGFVIGLTGTIVTAILAILVGGGSLLKAMGAVEGHQCT